MNNEADFDIDNEISNDDYLDDDNEEGDEDYEEENAGEGNNDFKLVTFKDVVDNIQKTPKKSVPFLTKFEKARIIGVRLQQLAYGAKPRVDVTGLKSIQEIADKELKERKMPFIIRRTMPNGKHEDWRMEEFLII
jgi:DNA-directed RNA polymerase I, II, and III subunit RPABC2